LFWWKIPLQVRVALAVLAFIIASLFTITQSVAPDPFRPPRKVFSLAWWKYPLEWNAPARLPKIECDLNAIYAVPNTETIWAAGNKGLVVASNDGGVTWTKRGITANQIVRATPTPTPRPAKASLFDLLDIVPTAEAASITAIETTGQEMGGKPTPSTSARPQVSPSPRSVPSPSPRPQSSPPSVSIGNTNRQQGPPQRNATPSPTPATAAASPTPTPADDLTQPPDALVTIIVDEQNDLWVGEEHQRIFRTSDGGIVWASVNPDDLEEPPFKQLHVSAGLLLSAVSLNQMPTFTGVYYVTGHANWGVGVSGIVWKDISEPTPQRTGVADDLQSIYFLDDNARGWISGSNGVILTTSDQGQTWQRQTSGTTGQLNAINFLPDGQHGWAAGNDGVILSSNDGGASWQHRTQGKDASGMYLRFPAPWYFLALIVIGLMVVPRREAPPVAEESVADVLISDRPLDTPAGDVLSFNAIALGLSRFLRNENTMPPLTIAITGEWGTGKSSLMNLLRVDLRTYNFRPVWFNAWHHQKEEHMLASLLENIKRQAVPRWWTSRGILFRARLLKIRGWRHWGPLLLLLFIVYVLAVYHAHQHGSDAGFVNFFKLITDSITNPTKSETASRLVTLIPLIAGVATFIGAAWRGCTAFGVKPASLLAGVTRGVSVRTLEAATSFRQKFAVEFSDVTRALGSRSLLIFIDDLDRCRPENVLETLEAVNFLTTSGECFVVMGMAREYVERCVGRAFKDIAEEMIDDLPASELPGNNSDQSKEKRIEFARQYLDKLINIEVPVPTVKEEQSMNLLLAGSINEPAPVPQTFWRGATDSSLNLARRYWRVLPALIVLTALGFGGYYLALSLVPIESETPIVAQAVSTPSPTPILTPTPTPTASPLRAIATASPSLTPTPIPTPDTSKQRAEVIVAGSTRFSRYVLPILGLLGLLWLGVQVLTRRPEAIVKDSPRFVEALKIWYPVIFSPKYSTPRSTKRFMNRVRYLAMRQRHPRSGGRPSWLELIRFPKNGNQPVVDEAASPSVMPDEALVALAAMEQFDPRSLQENYVLKKEATAAPGWGPFFKAKQAHTKEFGNFEVLQYRNAFEEMSSKVEVR
jgi:photosystem II stability/assembly factor-like uncharacterized protein